LDFKLKQLSHFKYGLLLVVLFSATFIVGYLGFESYQARQWGSASEVNWRDLGELDYVSGESSTRLKSLDGKQVKVPGFMVPLEDNLRKVTQFLLVPTPQACIHVPPPPPNQMILVEMLDGHEVDVNFGPIWIYGELKIFSINHQYGESSFVLKGIRIEPYQ